MVSLRLGPRQANADRETRKQASNIYAGKAVIYGTHPATLNWPNSDNPVGQRYQLEGRGTPVAHL